MKELETVDFDFDSVDRDVFGIEPDAAIEAKLASAALTFRLMEWICADFKNLDGVINRLVCAARAYNRNCLNMSLTDAALLIGKQKQSLGRCMEDFIQQFPESKTVNPKICK